MNQVKQLAREGRRVLMESRARILRRFGLLKGDWQTGLPEELQFWEGALKDGGRNWDREEYRERTDPMLELQPELKALIPAPPGAVVRILDVGAGPLTRLGKRWEGRELEIVAVDPLAEEYAAIMARISLRPLVPVTVAHGEKLLDRFAPNSFDLAYASNSLDHSYDPLVVMRQMLAVVKPQRTVYLWHFANAGVAAGYVGLHQWNFQLRQGDLVLSTGQKTQSVSAALNGEAELVCEPLQAFGKLVVVAKLKKLATG